MIQLFSPTIRRKEMDSVLTCMVDEKIGPGDINARFVSEIKNFLNLEGAVVFRNTSIALSRALKALLLPEKSAIVISALAPKWQKIAIEEAGFSVILAEVDESTFCITAQTAAAAIEQGGRAIIISQPFGQIPEDIAQIAELGVPIIEDISESAGGSLGEKKSGTFAEIAVWGLEATGIVTAGGGAALCFSQKSAWEAFAPIFRKIVSSDILPDLNCALGLVSLKEWRKNEEIRRTIASVFRSSVLQSRRHKTLPRGADCDFTAAGFPLVVSDGVKDVLSFLERKEIESKMAFQDSAISLISDEISESERENLKTAFSLFSRTVQIPLYPRLKSSHIQTISKVLAALP